MNRNVRIVVEVIRPNNLLQTVPLIKAAEQPFDDFKFGCAHACTSKLSNTRATYLFVSGISFMPAPSPSTPYSLPALVAPTEPQAAPAPGIPRREELFPPKPFGAHGFEIEILRLLRIAALAAHRALYADGPLP